MTRTTGIWLGLLAGLIAFYLFSFSHAAIEAAWAAYAVAIGIVVSAVIAIVLLCLGHAVNLCVGLIGFAVTFSLGVAASIASLQTVAERAVETAGDAPFCIQAANARGRDYKPVRALLDLSGLRLWSHARSEHHAVLIVGDAAPRLFHWSYRRREFVRGVLNENLPGFVPALVCVPARDFLNRLPVLFAPPEESRYIRFAPDEAYRIPHAYQPRWSGGSSRTLLLAIMAPDFTPSGRSWDTIPSGERDSHWVFIDWKPNWLLGLMAQSYGESGERGMEAGLHRRMIELTGPDGRRYQSVEYIAQPAGSDQVNTTLIRCSAPAEPPAKSCQHRFLHGGHHFYFRHAPQDVPRWREMQLRLVDLLAAFAVR